MAIQKVKSARVNNITVDEFIGDRGHIFFDEDVGELRLSDGETPGGISITTAGGGGGGTSVNLSSVNKNIVPTTDSTYNLGTSAKQWNNVYVNSSILLNGSALAVVDGKLTLDGQSIATDLAPATSTHLGGIKVGSGLSVTVDGTVSANTDYNNLTNKPNLSVYQTKANAFSGSYTDLTNKPTIPTVPTNISAFTNDAGYSKFSGSYTDLTNKPTIITSYNELANKPDLSVYETKAEAFSGNYDDLINKPDLSNIGSGGGYSSGVIKTFNIIGAFTAPVLGKANFVPTGTTTIKSVQLTTGARVGTDLMIGLYRNGDLLNFFTLHAGRFTTTITGLNYQITINDVLTVNVIAGSATNLALALMG
jgi:hypothetical protein